MLMDSWRPKPSKIKEEIKESPAAKIWPKLNEGKWGELAAKAQQACPKGPKWKVQVSVSFTWYIIAQNGCIGRPKKVPFKGIRSAHFSYF